MDNLGVVKVVQRRGYPRYWRMFTDNTGVWILGFPVEPDQSHINPDGISIVDSDEGASIRVLVTSRNDDSESDCIVKIVSGDILDSLTHLSHGWRIAPSALSDTAANGPDKDGPG